MPSTGIRTMSGGRFDWGGRLLKSNGGARRFPCAGRKSACKCKGIRELDFRVRNGNGYYLSTMATGIINNAIYEVRKTITRARRTDIRSFCMNGNDDMAKSHDLLVMLG